MQPVIAAARVATRARRAFVAGARDVVEVWAPRTLKQIAPDRRRVAKLRRCAGQKRFRDRGKALREVRIVREIGVAHEGSDTNAAARERLDPIEPINAIDVDETGRARDAAFHQIEQVGAGGEISGAGR